MLFLLLQGILVESFLPVVTYEHACISPVRVTFTPYSLSFNMADFVTLVDVNLS